MVGFMDGDRGSVMERLGIEVAVYDARIAQISTQSHAFENTHTAIRLTTNSSGDELVEW